MGDRNEQYLLDYWCDCRRCFRVGLSWASLTPEFDRKGEAVRRWTFSPASCGGASAGIRVLHRLLAECRVSTSVTSGASSPDLRPLHRQPNALFVDFRASREGRWWHEGRRDRNQGERRRCRKRREPPRGLDVAAVEVDAMIGHSGRLKTMLTVATSGKTFLRY
jgi:hypothetical protein